MKPIEAVHTAALTTAKTGRTMSETVTMPACASRRRSDDLLPQHPFVPLSLVVVACPLLIASSLDSPEYSRTIEYHSKGLKSHDDIIYFGICFHQPPTFLLLHHLTTVDHDPLPLLENVMATAPQTQQQRYPCPTCGSTFTRPQHVVRHLRSHTGERPYKCKECGDSFARSDLLSRHVNKCHPGLPTASQSSTVKQTRRKPCVQCAENRSKCDSGSPCTRCVQQRLKCSRSSPKTGQSTFISGPSPSSFQDQRPKSPFGPSPISRSSRLRRLSDSGSTASSRTSLSTAPSIRSAPLDGVHVAPGTLVPSSSSTSRPPALWSSRLGDIPGPSFVTSFLPSTTTGVSQQSPPDATSLYSPSALQSFVSGASQFTTQPQSQSHPSHQSQTSFTYRASGLSTSSTPNPMTFDSYTLAPDADVYANSVEPSNTPLNPQQTHLHAQQQPLWSQLSATGEPSLSSEIIGLHNTHGPNPGLGDSGTGTAEHPFEFSHPLDSACSSPAPFSDRARAPHRPYNYIIGYGRSDPASANSSDAEYEYGLNSRTSRPSTAGSSRGVGAGSNHTKNMMLYSNPPASNSASSLSSLNFPPPVCRLSHTSLDLEVNAYTPDSVGFPDRSPSSPPLSGVSQTHSLNFGAANDIKIEEAPTEGQGLGVDVREGEGEKENARDLKEWWTAWMAPMYSAVSEKEAFIGPASPVPGHQQQTSHVLQKTMSMSNIKTPTVDLGTMRGTLGAHDVVTPRGPSQAGDANVRSFVCPPTVMSEDLSKYQEACLARETPQLLLAPRSRCDPQGRLSRSENELSRNSPEPAAGGGGGSGGGMRRPSSIPSQQQRHHHLQGHSQGQGQNHGRSLESRPSPVQAYLLPTAPDTPLAKLNMTGQMGDPRPSYKRLPSQVLGPTDVKRTAFDLSAMPDGDEEALCGDDEDGEDDRPRDISLCDYDRGWMPVSENWDHVSSAKSQIHRRSMSSPSSTRPTTINAFAAFPGLGPDLSSRHFIPNSTPSPLAPSGTGRVVSTTTTAAF